MSLPLVLRGPYRHISKDRRCYYRGFALLDPTLLLWLVGNYRHIHTFWACVFTSGATRAHIAISLIAVPVGRAHTGTTLLHPGRYVRLTPAPNLLHTIGMAVYMLLAPLWAIIAYEVLIDNRSLVDPKSGVLTIGVGILLYAPVMVVYWLFPYAQYYTDSFWRQWIRILWYDHLLIVAALASGLFLYRKIFAFANDNPVPIAWVLTGYYCAEVINRLFVLSLPLNGYEALMLPTIRMAQYFTCVVIFTKKRVLWALPIIVGSLLGTLMWYKIVLVSGALVVVWMGAVIYYTSIKSR